MTVKAPHFIYYTSDKYTQLFICFAYMIAKEYGFKTAYYIHSGDVRIFFPKKGITIYKNTILSERIKAWILLGKTSRQIWRFNFVRTRFKEVDFEITCEKDKAIWMYLEGLYKNNVILDQKQKGLRRNWRRNVLNQDVIDWLKDR